jgi:4-amino-4-deoxy-L-arabinose transferase-like glycosyltransferase
VSARVGLLAAAVAAVNPNLWMNDAVIMSESISALLIVATIACGYALHRQPTLQRAALAGAVIGLTVLARAEIGLFLPLMIVPVLVRAGDLTWLQRAGRLALATFAMVLVIAPWSLWNQTRFHDSVPLSTNDGTTLLGANCPRAFNSNITGGWAISCVLKTDVTGLDASQASAKQRKLGIDYAKAHLGRLPLVVFAREGRTFGFWRPDQSVYINTGEGREEWASWAGLATFWALVPVSILGAFGLRRRGVTLIPVAATLLTVLAVSALFYGIPRFRLPLDVATCLLAAVVVDDAWRRLRPNRA